MALKYLGPSDFFAVGDRFYRPGQNVPISKEAAIHHMRLGHRFEGIESDEVGMAEPPMTELKPIGDDGKPIDEAKVSSAPVAPVAAGQPTGETRSADKDK